MQAPDERHPPDSDPGNPSFVTRVFIVGGVVALALAAWTAVGVLLLTFGAVLLAIALRAFVELIARRTGWSERLAFAAALVIVALVVGLAGWGVGDRVGQQVRELAQTLPDTVQRVRAWLEQNPLGETLLQPLGSLGGEQALARVGKVAGSTVDAAGNLVLVAFLAVYLAADPALYRRGLVSLFVPRHRQRVDDAMGATGQALRGWLLGQAIAMVVVGVATGVGLALLGVPLALTLALLAALLEFVPFVGPIIAAVPAVLLAFTLGPQTALHVVLLYAVIQQLEGYVLQPLVQRRTAALPPALTLASIVGFGLLFGVPGIVLGVPLAVAAMVLVQRLWIDRLQASS